MLGRLPRCILKAASGTVLLGIGGASTSFHQNDYSLSNIGVIRFASRRSADGDAEPPCQICFNPQEAAETIVDYKWSLIGLTSDSEKYKERMNQCHLRGVHRLLNLAKANGGVFIKVGQHIASLEYLLPEEYTSTMSVLHSKAPESDLDELKQVFRSSVHKEAFSEVNMLEINWKLGVHDLRSYTPLRVGVDDDVLRTCLEKKVACVYDSSGVASIVTESTLMNFCFSRKEVLRKTPNVTHGRLMQGRRCLFLHVKVLSAEFVKLFVQGFQTRENVDVPLCIRITTAEAPAFDLDGFTPRSNGLETEVTVENRLQIRFGEKFGTSHHQITITTV